MLKLQGVELPVLVLQDKPDDMLHTMPVVFSVADLVTYCITVIFFTRCVNLALFCEWGGREAISVGQSAHVTGCSGQLQFVYLLVVSDQCQLRVLTVPEL